MLTGIQTELDTLLQQMKLKYKNEIERHTQKISAYKESSSEIEPVASEYMRVQSPA